MVLDDCGAVAFRISPIYLVKQEMISLVVGCAVMALFLNRTWKVTRQRSDMLRAPQPELRWAMRGRRDRCAGRVEVRYNKRQQ